MGKQKKHLISKTQQGLAEAEIKNKQNEIKYDLRDFTIDYIVQQFKAGEFYVPHYQRQYVWKESNKCRFIESVLLGLPIPMMFVADVDDGRLEIVDGAQRIQTLEAFLNDDIILKGLTQLSSINGFLFSDLPISQQRKFKTKALRMVILEDKTTIEIRQEIFDRVNTSGLKAKPSEIRRGTFDGEFMTFIKDCANSTLFLKLCPLSEGMKDRREGEELVLRFFAYSNRYKSFRHDVFKFIDAYVKEVHENFDLEQMRNEFDQMLTFVNKNFPYGFAKTKGAKSTPRVRFEAISVGVNLALGIDPDLEPLTVLSWIDSEEFKTLTTTHASNSGPKLRGRIEYVRDTLLAK